MYLRKSLSIVVLAASVGAVTGTQGTFKWPATPVGQVAQAFVRAFNSGDAAQMRAFYEAHLAASARATRSIEQRLETYPNAQGDLGKIVPVEVAQTTTDSLTIKADIAEGRAELTFKVEPRPPHGMLSLAVEIGGPGGERETPGAPAGADDRPQRIGEPVRRVGGGPQQPAFPAPAISASQSATEMGTALDAYLSKLAAEDRFSGVVLVAKEGTPIFERAYGLADRSSSVPNTPATRFNLGSLNKQFTKVGIEQLIANQKLTLTDTIGALLPDYPNEQARKATIQQLLDHRGGIADFFGPAFDKLAKNQFRSNADYFRFVAPQPLLFEPGTQERYCNGCYIVLGAVIERLSGLPYERYIAERVFAPAGMKGAGAFAADEIVPRVAIGYTRRGPSTPPGAATSLGTGPEASEVLRSNIYTRGAAGCAAGGGYATASDLLAFVNAARNKRLDGGRGGVVGDAGLAGGAPGTAALIESAGLWTAIVLSNLDPPAASVGAAIIRQLRDVR